MATTMSTVIRGRGLGRGGRLLAVAAVALAMLLGHGAGDAGASTSVPTACNNLSMLIHNTANQALAAYDAGDTATGNALSHRLSILLNRSYDMGC